MPLRNSFVFMLAAQIIAIESAVAALPTDIQTEFRRTPVASVNTGSLLLKSTPDPMRVNLKEFMINRSVRVKVDKVEDSRRKHVEGQDVLLEKGDLLTLIEERGEYVRIGMDSEATDASLPSDFWVLTQELEAAGLASYDISALSEEELEEFEDALEFVETEVAARSRRGGARQRRGVTKCYRHVKNYLLSQGELNFRPGGGSAFMAAHELGAAGMSRGGCSPSNPVKNCTCVYKGGKHGHVETYRENGCWWYGYGCKPAMSTLRMGRSGQRRLVTCYQ